MNANRWLVEVLESIEQAWQDGSEFEDHPDAPCMLRTLTWEVEAGIDGYPVIELGQLLGAWKRGESLTADGLRELTRLRERLEGETR